VEDRDFVQFIHNIKEFTGIDLSQYKEAQMKRRLTTLRLKRGYATFAAYFDALRKDRTLLEEFLDRMTINVSEFWRNRVRWETLERVFLPRLAAESGGRLKCWSAACSTGEEAYTLAMILAEKGMLPSAQILATDIDKGVLARAKAGVYPDRSIREVPEPYLRKYFRKEGSMYRISETLMPYIRFEQHNLLADSYGHGYDLIICRNVLIYFTEEAKDQLYRRFAAALRPGGILFVGSTEQIFSPGKYGFESAETFFYRKMR
jgi:chemotaxis protein methyltransferase CheR